MLWQRLALIVVAAGMLLILMVRGRHSGREPAVAAFSMSIEPVAWLQVAGAVRHSGTYPLFDKNMTNDVIKMSDPLCGISIDHETVNNYLAERRGALLNIHCQSPNGLGYTELQALPAAQGLVLNVPLSLNRASVDELMLVPGIGPALAKRIVRYRQIYGGFRDIQELQQVEGIAEKKLNSMKRFVTP